MDRRYLSRIQIIIQYKITIIMSACEHYLPLTLLDFKADSLVASLQQSDGRRVNFDDTLAHSHSNQHDELLLEEEEEEEEEEEDEEEERGRV